MSTIKVLLSDLHAAGLKANVGEEVFENHLQIVAEAGVPYIKQEERSLGHFKDWIEGHPNLFLRTEDHCYGIHHINCYVKREIQTNIGVGCKYILIST